VSFFPKLPFVFPAEFIFLDAGLGPSLVTLEELALFPEKKIFFSFPHKMLSPEWTTSVLIG